MKKRRILSCLLALCMLLALLPVYASAEDAVTSGTLDARTGILTWEFADGTLTITGDGYCVDDKVVPWEHLQDQVKSLVFDGSLSILTFHFSNFPNLTSITWPDNLTYIASAFHNCYSLESITVPDTVYDIDGLCNNCISLTHVDLPSALTGLSGSFIDCKMLTNITLPNKLKNIASSSFAGSGLTGIVFPSSVKTIYRNLAPFANCTDLDTIVFLGDPPAPAYDFTFGGLDATVYYPAGNSKWTESVRNSFDPQGTLTWVSTWNPSGIEIEQVHKEKTWVFQDNTLTVSTFGEASAEWSPAHTDIKEIIILDGVTDIPRYAFDGCSSLTSITIPDSVTSIGENAFNNCESLCDITIPDGVTYIGNFAFAHCSSLRTITIPAGISEIYSYTFRGCYNLEEIYFKGDAPTISDIGTFQSVTATAYYPLGNATWTEDVLQNYDGELTWVPYCANHDYTSVTTDPDCIHPGSTISTCSLCGHTEEETFGYPSGQHTYLDDTDTTCEVCGSTRDLSTPTTPMYRLYNPNTGEHFYTGSLEERDMLIAAGWTYEGIAWNAPTKSGAPVYRLFNPNSGDHHYTMSAEERDMLVGVGWQYEGVCWNSASASNLPLYRLYNPNADCGSHHYTGSEEERDNLVAVGWIYEGIGWFGMIK